MAWLASLYLYEVDYWPRCWGGRGGNIFLPKSCIYREFYTFNSTATSVDEEFD